MKTIIITLLLIGTIAFSISIGKSLNQRSMKRISGIDVLIEKIK